MYTSNAMLMAPMSVSMSEASGGATYDPEMVEYIRTVISETGTYTVVEDSAHNVITTNTVTLDGSVYIVHTTTTASGEVINEETVYITPTRNGMYGFENSARNIGVRFTDQESYAQGQPSQSRTSTTITLSDRAYAEDGEVITLTDDYRGCSGNYATFTAGVDAADDTLMTWRAIAVLLVLLPVSRIRLHQDHARGPHHNIHLNKIQHRHVEFQRRGLVLRIR